MLLMGAKIVFLLERRLIFTTEVTEKIGSNTKIFTSESQRPQRDFSDFSKPVSILEN